MTTNGTSLTTGTEVISVCTKCKLSLAHIIVAMDEATIKKVRCSTCGKEHRYVSPDAKKKAPSSRTRVRVEEQWKQLVDSLSSRKKIPYTVSGFYKEKDLIDHHVFGLGIVNQVVSREIIRVLFKEGEKLLASARVVQ